MARTAITLEIDPDSVFAGRASFAALNTFMSRLSVASVARLDALHQFGDGKRGFLITSFAKEGRLFLVPSKRYRKDVAAVAADATHPDGLTFEIEYRHGWPILSIAAPSDAGTNVIETRRFEKHEVAPAYRIDRPELSGKTRPVELGPAYRWPATETATPALKAAPHEA